MGAVEEIVAVCWALGAYRRWILPAARRELGGWERRAAAIADPQLRGVAIGSLRLKRRNPEATAVFALLAPRRWRATVLGASVALQVAVDYLDELTERPGTTLAAGLSMHGALAGAVAPTGTPAELGTGADGGYLETLLGACRHGFASLPGAVGVAPAAGRAATRCAEGQSYTHAGDEALEAWAMRLSAPPGYRWWERAAGASSSVALHALIAAAADGATDPDYAALVDAAYYPPIGALTVLLDDLVDYDEDLARNQHNYLTHYADADDAAARLALIADRARAATGELRQRRRHRSILAGVAGFYLSAAAPSRFAAPARERLLEAIGPGMRSVLLAMELGGRG
jgi:tetraprenyl-beta-curcumene synthase